jgi:hypothetical protein
MDTNSVEKVRQTLYDRLLRFNLTPEQLEDKSLFQLVNLVYLFAGHLNYLGCFTTTCRTMEEILGEQGFYSRIEKPEHIVREENEPKPKQVVH